MLLRPLNGATCALRDQGAGDLEMNYPQQRSEESSFGSPGVQKTFAIISLTW
jgi:hypothetical protein